MNEEKRNRIIAAITVNVILLIAILAAVIIYQIISMVILDRKRESLKAEYNNAWEKTESLKGDLAYYESDEYLLDLAYKYGFIFGK